MSFLIKLDLQEHLLLLNLWRDGVKVPESMLKIVLLPEPLGPMRPRISPCSTANERLLTAVKPPKRLTSPLTSSTGGLTSAHRASSPAA